VLYTLVLVKVYFFGLAVGMAKKKPLSGRGWSSILFLFLSLFKLPNLLLELDVLFALFDDVLLEFVLFVEVVLKCVEFCLLVVWWGYKVWDRITKRCLGRGTKLSLEKLIN